MGAGIPPWRHPRPGPLPRRPTPVPGLRGELMTTSRGLWVPLGRGSRTVCGLAVLAAGPFALAACATPSSRALHEPAYPQPGARMTVRSDGSPPPDGSIGAPGSPSSSTSGSGTGTAASCVAMAAATRTAEDPSRTSLRGDPAGCESSPLTPPRGEVVNKSYAVAAADIVGFEFLLNQYDRHVVSRHTYGSNGESIRRNLSGGWQYDGDPFKTNQFQHPYGG